MRAILSIAPGGPETLGLETIGGPTAGPDEVVIGVHAVGLNFFDTLIIRDRYQFRPERPFSPGGELAGVIEAIGPGVSALKPGDRVAAYVKWGGAREKMVVPAEDVIAMPDELDFDKAAGLIVTYGTTLHALRDRADLQAGETLAVLGASGGVGQAAIEIGLAMGARVIACASSDAKLEFCRSIGADATINYSTEDLKNRLKELTDGRGVDVVYDPVGGGFAEPALRATAWNGRFLVIGFAAGDIPKIPLNLALLKGCSIVGVFWGESINRDPDGHKRNVRQLMKWSHTGKIGPHIDTVLPLEDTATALQKIADREVRGKVILRV